MAAKQCIEIRFWSKVDKSGECWLWTGSTSVNGYGMLSVNNRPKGAHRISYELANGPLTGGRLVLVCHTCDNRRCVRPSHLFLGSHVDNAVDMVNKGRAPRQKLTVEQVRYAYQSPKSRAAISRELGVTPEMISHIKLGKIWKHLHLATP